MEQQKTQLRQAKLSDEGYKELSRIANERLFTIPKQGDFNFGDALKKCMNCFTPIALGLPDEWYAETLIHKGDKFTYADMCMIAQILPQATGRAMNIQSRQYAQYIICRVNILKAWGEEWNALLDEMAAKYPAPKMITEVDPATGESRLIPAEGNTIPMPPIAQA